MNTVVRDLTIAGLLLFTLLIVNVVAAIRRRVRRPRIEAERAEAERERRAKEIAPVPGLAEHAAGQGWKLLHDPGFDPATAGYVARMLGNLSGSTEGAPAEALRFANLYGGESNGHRFVIGNVWTATVGAGETAGDRQGSVCAVDLGTTLPPLFVNPRSHPPFLRMFLEEEKLESEEFNRRFQVLAMDREYAMDVMSARAMEVVMARDDWAFCLDLSSIVCVCSTAMASLPDYQERLAAVASFVSLIPPFVEQDKGIQLPTLPDGTQLDPRDPASRDKLEAALSAMPPEEREAYMERMQAAGIRFVAGMLGKRIPEGVVEEAQRKLAGRDPPP